jgi:hypothetical protein
MSDVIRHETSPRIFFDEPVAILAPGSDVPRHGRALNLSAGGLYVCCEELLPEDSIVRLTFTLPGSGTISADASVVRSVCPDDALEPCGMALHFTSLDSESAALLTQFIDGRLQPPPGEAVRLLVGELNFPIVAHTQGSWDNVLSVDAELPFLRLGSPVQLQLPAGWEDSLGHGSIRWVSIHVPPSTGVPRLNIGIALQPPRGGVAVDDDDVAIDDVVDPVCNHSFADHSRDLDQAVRAERRQAAAT